MLKYSANYAKVDANFVIQNLVENPLEEDWPRILLVLKNIIQRGNPTLMSRFLRKEIGEIDHSTEYKIFSYEEPYWNHTILGDEGNQYFPARKFYYEVIPRYFGDYSFIQRLLLPEATIRNILQKDITALTGQRVDFYLPLAKLVIEIDGSQHLNDHIINVNDEVRNDILSRNGVKTIRISTTELESDEITDKVQEISQHLAKPSIRAILDQYLESEPPKQVLQATAIIRFQVLLVELLIHRYLNLDQEWKINLILSEEEELGAFAELALEDLKLWLQNLYRLKEKADLPFPDYQVERSYSREQFKPGPEWVNIDFSVSKRWTDEVVLHPDLLFVRSDYWGKERNFFKVSSGKLIDYKITDDDRDTLTFFLQNIFDKKNFREGQLPIINNVLNRRDTIGLLPTGGGKSLCYQLPSLLQPAISFVVCPIKSLMYDQKLNMDRALITNTNYITGDQSPAEKERVQDAFSKGQYLFIWVSPERFQIQSFREYISRVNNESTIAHAVIDEVHCLSEWGHDFRTSYLNLARTIERFCPGASYIGLTATASINVLKDIRVEFGRGTGEVADNNILSLLDYSRKELEFEVIETKNAFKELKDFIQDFDLLDQEEKAALIFTPNVNGPQGCYHLANNLSPDNTGRIKWYSGKVPMISEVDDFGNTIGRIPAMGEEEFKNYKARVQQDFQENQFSIMVATKAFGMGIDKSNIHYSFHNGLPGSVESLYQEAGRAGRWDKNDPVLFNQKAYCKVLYTKETVDENLVNELFNIETKFQRIREINEDVGWSGKDIFRQVFLFTQGQLDTSEWVKLISMILREYYEVGEKIIFFTDCTNKIQDLGIYGGNNQLRELAQKAIYKLSLLGVVEDWTTDFVNHYRVIFKPSNENTVFTALESYLGKYNANIDLKAELEKLPKLLSKTQKCIWYLQQWTFENIVYNRKQALKTLVDWCNEFPVIGNEKFKARLDNYFRFTETTFKYQYIAEHPEDYDQWFQVFCIPADEPTDPEVYIFDLKSEEARRTEIEKLRDGLSRYLETYAKNPGLNYISGLVRLYLDDFENTDGRNRFEGAWDYIISDFEPDTQEEVLNRTLQTGTAFTSNQREELYIVLVKFFPEKEEALAEALDVLQVLYQALDMRIEQLKYINDKINQVYEQIG